MNLIKKKFSNLGRFCSKLRTRVRAIVTRDVYVAKDLSQVPPGSIVFFPLRNTLLCCGLAGIVAVKKKRKTVASAAELIKMV